MFSILPRALRNFNQLLQRNGYAYFEKSFITALEMENVFRNIVYLDNEDDYNKTEHVTYDKKGMVSRDFIDGTSDKVFNVGTSIPLNVVVNPHNEMGYNPSTIPEFISFGCFQPAISGGNTVISDVQLFTENLAESMKQKFREYGVLYQRILHDGERSEEELCYALGFSQMSKSFQDYFNVQKKEEINALNGMKIDYNFRGLDCAICVSHTMDPWMKYNGKELLVHSLLDSHGSYFDLFSIENQLEYNYRPTHTKWGNGEEFSKNEIEMMKTVYAENSIEFKLNKGDMIVLNNILFTHWRSTFVDAEALSEKRKIGTALLGNVCRNN